MRQFSPPTDAVERAYAQQAAAALADTDSQANVVPQWRRATIVSYQGGSPPTCTVTWDDVTNVPGIQFLWPYVPVGGDEVFTIGMDGLPVVGGKITEIWRHAEHYSTYTRTADGAAFATNTTQQVTGWDAKESTYLSEPEGSLDGGLPTDSFTLPYSAVWEIHCTASLTVAQKGWGVRLEILSPVAAIVAEGWAGAPSGGAGPMGKPCSVSMKRYLAGSGVIAVRLINTVGNNIARSADGVDSPMWISFSSTTPEP